MLKSKDSGTRAKSYENVIRKVFPFGAVVWQCNVCVGESVCVCDCLTQGWKGVARKYQEEQLDFYERNWISSRHIIIGEHFMGADPRRTKKAAQFGRGTQTESGKEREGERGTEWLYTVCILHTGRALLWFNAPCK